MKIVFAKCDVFLVMSITPKLKGCRKKVYIQRLMATNQDSQMKTYPNGTMEWLNAKGKRHRDGDKPAVIRADGTLCWYLRGKLHRDGDKPAIISADGTLSWWRHGERHRDGDKPVKIYADGAQRWWQHGKLVCSGSNLAGEKSPDEKPSEAEPSGEKSSDAKPSGANPSGATLEVAIEKWRAAVRTMKAARSSILNAMDAEERL